MKSIRQIREASGGKEAYQKFFNSILKKFGVDSPSELKGDKKKEFFDAIDKGWDGDNEKAESVSEAKKLSGGKGKAKIDINFMGDKKDAKFAATKYKIGIKVTSNGAILSGDKQKILAYLQGQDYAMDAEDIEDLYPELMETYDDPDNYESEKDVTLNPDENPLATGKSLGEAFAKSYGYTHTEEAINHLMKSLQPKSALARTISANADNVTREFTKMSKLMDKIMEQWEAVEMVIGMNESVDEAANSSLLKKAQAIASKLSGNMTKAVAEIEKLKKGLSNDKKVMAMLKTANEATIPQGKTAMTKKDSVTKKDRNTLSKIGKMLDKEKKSRKEAMAMCEQCGQMHEEGACGESVDEAAKVLSKKGDYAFSTYRNKEVDVTYKGKVIATGDFDSGADAWFLDIKGTKGQRSFDSAADVIKFFMKNKITEAVSVDRRTTGFKEALKRRAEAKAKREAMKIKAAKKQSKDDMANIDANYAYDGDIEEILTSANKKIMGEDAPVNASSSGAVDMNPTGKSKKKDKESLVTRSASIMAKRGY